MNSTKSGTIGQLCFLRRRAINVFTALVVWAGMSLTSAVAATVQNLFVADNSGTIYLVTGNGTVTTFLTGLNEPFGVVCDSAGNLYVSLWGGGGSGSGSVNKYSPNGDFISTVASGLDEPTDMAFDDATNLYISDYGDGLIYQVTPGGTQSVFDSGLYAPSGMTYGGSYLFVAEGNGNIDYYEHAGGTLYPARSLYLSLPAFAEQDVYFSLSFDSAGLFIGDYANGLTYEYQSNGTLSQSATVTGLLLGLACDSQGDVFEGDGAKGSLYEYVYNYNNGSINLNSTPNIFASGLAAGAHEITDLTFQPQVCSGATILQNLFAVAQNGTIYMLAPDGTQSTFASGLNEPFGLAFDNASDLYVSTWTGGGIGRGYVYKYTPEGVKSTFASGLSEPTYMAFDSLGNLYISDYGDNAIYKVTPGGAKSTFSSGVYYPSGIAFDSSGDLFVADGNGDIDEYVNSGGTLSTSPTPFASGMTVVGEEADYFSLSLDSGNNVYAADYANGEIYEFTSSGTLSSTYLTGVDPEGLTFDSAGDLFSANESSRGSIYAYQHNGNGGLSSTPVTVAQNVAGGYEIHDVKFQTEPVPYWGGTFLSYDPLTYGPVPFYSGPAYSQTSDSIYALSGPDTASQPYNGDSFAYGIQSGLDPIPIFQWDTGDNFYDSDSWMPTPAVGSDGTVYVATYNGALYAINPDGSEKWACDAITEDGLRIAASPSIGLDGNIYIATDDPGRVFYCIDPDLGLPKWKLLLQDQADMDASPLCTTEGIYCEDEYGELHYITYLGQEYTPLTGLGTSFGSSSPAIVEGGLLCIGDGANLDVIDPTPLDSNGKGVLQTYQLDGSQIDASPIIGPDETVYVGTSGGNFFAVQIPYERTDPPAMAILAETSFPSSSHYPTTAAIGSDSIVYVGTSDGDGGSGPGFFYSMHLQPVCGQQYPEQFVIDWQTNIPDGGFLGSPLIAQVGSNHSTNVVYDANVDGNVFAFFASAGPSTTTWSTFKGNDQRQDNWGTGSIPFPELWNVQFGPSDISVQTGKAAYGNTGNDYWNPENSGNSSFSVLDYTGEESQSSPELAVTVSCSTGVSAQNAASGAFNDNLMTNYIYSANASSVININISGLPTTPLNSTVNSGQALYDVYVYAYGGHGETYNYNSTITVSPTGTDPLSGNPEPPKTTLKTPAPDPNLFTEGSEYVVFHNVPVTTETSPGSPGEITITVAADSNNSGVSFPLINGIQIVAKQ